MNSRLSKFLVKALSILGIIWLTVNLILTLKSEVRRRDREIQSAKITAQSQKNSETAAQARANRAADRAFKDLSRNLENAQRDNMGKKNVGLDFTDEEYVQVFGYSLEDAEKDARDQCGMAEGVKHSPLDTVRFCYLRSLVLTQTVPTEQNLTCNHANSHIWYAAREICSTWKKYRFYINIRTLGVLARRFPELRSEYVSRMKFLSKMTE